MRLTLDDIQLRASILNVEPEAIQAVIAVETPYPHVGDLEQGKPLILNERHWFYRFLKNRNIYVNDKSIYAATPGGYCRKGGWEDRQMCEHQKLKKKMAIHDEAALKSISMGLFQVMGFNHEKIGYSNVFDMWDDALKMDDTIDLKWFSNFIKSTGLLKHLQTRNWAAFARGYNGPQYKKWKYDEKLKAAYEKFKEKGNDNPYDDLEKMNVLPPMGFPPFNERHFELAQ